MQKQFTDMHGRSICDGAEIYFNGFFPMMMPVLDDELYLETGDKCPRNGFAHIEDGVLQFVARINGKLWFTGLTWELDREPCHDLIITEEVEIIETETIKYRGITAEINPCKRGYKCVVTDRHGNYIDWFIRANTMQDAVTKATSHFDNAIRYLRGFIALTDFTKRVEA